MKQYMLVKDIDYDLIRAKVIVKEIREEAKKNGTIDMSLEEINEEIEMFKKGF